MVRVRLNVQADYSYAAVRSPPDRFLAVAPNPAVCKPRHHREITIDRPFGWRFGDYVYCPSAERCGSRDRSRSAGCASGKCADFLLGLYREVHLADKFGGVLSISRSIVVGMDSRRHGNLDDDRLRCAAARAEAISIRRLALVSRNIGTSHRAGAGRITISSGPLHVYPSGRNL